MQRCVAILAEAFNECQSLGWLVSCGKADAKVLINHDTTKFLGKKMHFFRPKKDTLLGALIINELQDQKFQVARAIFSHDKNKVLVPSNKSSRRTKPEVYENWPIISTLLEERGAIIGVKDIYITRTEC